MPFYKTHKFAIVLVLLTLSLHFTLAEDDASKLSGKGSFVITAINPESVTNTNTVKPKTNFKPTYTRAELKVSRSLNPNSMQTLNVRTNNGGVATILVKKRDGKTTLNNEPRLSTFYDMSNQFSRGEVRLGLFGSKQLLEQMSDDQIHKLHQQQQQFENARLYHGWSQIQPVTTLQQQTSSSYRFTPPKDEKSVNIINSFMKHVQQIESNRQQRSSSILQNDRSQVYTSVPEPVVVKSENFFIKETGNKRARSLMEIGSDGIPVISGIRVPDDENDKKQTWRQGRVINGELVPYENGYIPPKTIEYGQLIYPVKEESQGRQKSIGPFTTSDNFSDESEDKNKSIGPFTVEDMASSRSNTKNGIGPFSVSDNSRTSNAKLIDYIKRINDQETRKEYFVGGRVTKDARGQQKIQRRMLINPGNANFPPSSRYSVTEKTMKTNESPITSYAHPEFGLQSINSYDEPKHNKYYNNHRITTNNVPTYQIEPALNTHEYYQPRIPHVVSAEAMKTNYNYAYIRRVRPEQPFWVKISDQVRDTFQSGFSHVAQVTKPVMVPLLEAGEKISQNLGFSHPKPLQAQEKVGVVIPNNGVSFMPGNNYIFPALGMLAGGAALGLGAIAMGRIFDVGSLLSMRSNDPTFDIEHKRALKAIRKMPTATLYLVDENRHQSLDEHNKNAPLGYAHDDSEAKFVEKIAVPLAESDGKIDPTSSSDNLQETNHQRRKRNK